MIISVLVDVVSAANGEIITKEMFEFTKPMFVIIIEDITKSSNLIYYY